MCIHDGSVRRQGEGRNDTSIMGMDIYSLVLFRDNVFLAHFIVLARDSSDSPISRAISIPHSLSLLCLSLVSHVSLPLVSANPPPTHTHT